MRFICGSAIAVAIVSLASTVFSAQGQEGARAVAGGGISVPGWTGKIDANEEKAGQVLNNSKLTQTGNVLHVTTGPAVTYWNPANKASGNYSVKATFMEPKYMSINDHPHPYGIVIGGNDLGTAQQSYLYCAAYGDCSLQTSPRTNGPSEGVTYPRRVLAGRVDDVPASQV